MTRRWNLAGAARVGVVLAACAAPGLACQRAPDLNPAERREIEGLLEQQRQAWNRGDLEGYMAAYWRSPALVFTSGGKIRRGWDATFTAYRARYGSDRASMGQLAFTDLDIQAVGAGAAIVLGHWRLTDTPEAGAGVFSVVLDRRPEGWRIVHDHTSSSGP